MEYYIHQIGSINNAKTYERLIKILNSKIIASREFLETAGIQFDYDNDDAAFKLNIPKGQEWAYYSEDIHKDRVSLSDPQNLFIRHAIKRKDHQVITCFDYDYIAFAVSREVPIVSKEQTKGLALGEVQVKDKIDSEYIVGLILPFAEEQLQDEATWIIIDKISEICNQNNFPLDIYNYEGELLKKKHKGIEK